MSNNLYWSEIPKEPKEYSIGGLRYILAKKIWDSDGSCGQGKETIGIEIVPFLEGIEEGGQGNQASIDARKLINAILKNGKVHIYIAG